MLDHLRAMAVFQAVAETGSFRGAGRKLSLSPSVISHHVSQLEAHFGLALLYRTTRKLSLTDAGRELLLSAQDMTEAATRGLTAMQLRSDQPVGRLKITCPTVMEHASFLDLFVEFSRSYPRVDLSLDFTMQPVELEGSDYDLALRGTATHLSDSSYRCRKLLRFNMVWVASPAYANGKKPPASVADLLAWDRIQFPRIPAKIIRDLFGLDPAVRIPTARLETDNGECARRFATAGLGCSLIDYSIVRDDLETGRLVRLLPDHSLVPIWLWALWPANAGPDSLALRFVDFIAARRSRVEVLPP